MASLYHINGEVFYSKVIDDDNDHVDDGGQPLPAVSNDRDVFRGTAMVALSLASPAANDCVVVVHDETTMAPPVQVIVVVQVEDKCGVVRHGETSHPSTSSSATAASEEDDVSFLESNREMVEDAGRNVSSDESWRVAKVKRLINMVTLVPLLILLYTRGIIL